MKYFLYSLIIVSFYSCSNEKPPKISDRKICLITFGSEQHEFLPIIKDKIEKFYGCSVSYVPNLPIPLNCYNPIRKTYYADSALRFLDKKKTIDFNHIIGITDADITTVFYNKDEKAVFGLGYCPGNSSIISTNRLYRDLPSQEVIKNRISNLAIHELGHNFGLKHCQDRACLMHDTQGLIANTEGDLNLCKNCKAILVKL